MSALRLLDGYTPSDLGLDGYEEYRTHPVTGQPVQLEVIEFAATSRKRVVGLCVPTGVGKSLVAMSVAKLKDARTAILTATKGLEKQYLDDLGRYGLINIHGKANYTCHSNPALDCRSGPVAGCKQCSSYGSARDEAREAEQVITNYDYWLNSRGKIERAGKIADLLGPNPIQILICDEGHEADKKLSDYLSVRIYERDVEYDVDVKTFGENVHEWVELAERRKGELADELEGFGQEIEHLACTGSLEPKHIQSYHYMEKLLAKFERLSTMQDDWVIEKRVGTQWGRMWAMDVKWPGRYSELLFCGVPKVILMSATLRPHHMRRLGVSKDEYEFKEWEPIFPKQRCPVYYLPARSEDGKDIRVTNKSSQSALLEWVRHIDELIDQRKDRRCLVLTTSYKYQRHFLEHSRHASYMIANNSEDPDTPNAQIAFDKFIATEPPVVLCSPSFGTGWDFKGARCEFMVISKVPLKPPPSTSKLAAARYAQDEEYFDAETMSDIQQAVGRLQRSEEDRGEIVLSDGTWSWFGPVNKHLASSGFVDRVRRVVSLPPRPEKL